MVEDAAWLGTMTGGTEDSAGLGGVFAVVKRSLQEGRIMRAWAIQSVILNLAVLAGSLFAGLISNGSFESGQSPVAMGRGAAG